MANPGWKSLLNFDQLLEAWQSPDTGAPQRVSLLRHIADLAAAVDPADRKGDGNTLPPLGKGEEKRPSALPITVEGQDDDGVAIPPPPDFGAKDVTPAGIVEALDSGGRYKDWDAATLRGWAELSRQDPDKAKRMLAEVSARRDASAQAAPAPTDKGSDWINGTATAKILPEGKFTVVVNSSAPKDGPILPPGSVRLSDKDMTPDEMLTTLRRMAPHIGNYTEQERKAGTSLAYRLERLKEGDPNAFGKLPGELKKFLEFFKEQMDDERAGIKPKNPNDETIELPANAWKKMTDRSAEHALMRAVRSFGTRMAIRGAVNVPADAAEILSWISPAGKPKELTEKFAEGYRDVTRRVIPVPPEYEDDPGLQAAETVGGRGGKSLAKKGRKLLKPLLKIFK